MYYSWSKEFLEVVRKKRPARDAACAATSDEVKDFRHEVQEILIYAAPPDHCS
jgi:hypothetical protein